MLAPQTSLARRTCLTQLGVGALLVSRSSSALAEAEPNSQAELLSRRLPTTGIEVTLPPLADNSNAIPLQFTLQAPAGQQLVGFEIIAPENPNRVILRFKLGQAQARLSFSTRIRLAMTQEVWVLAHLSNGSSLGRPTHTVVTATACFDET
jgi:predicted secreted protein